MKVLARDAEKRASATFILRQPPDTDTMTSAVIHWKRYMQMHSTLRTALVRPQIDLRNPRTLHWHCPETCARATSSFPRSENHTILWKKSSASASPAGSLQEYGVIIPSGRPAGGRNLRLRQHPRSHQREDKTGNHPAFQGICRPAQPSR